MFLPTPITCATRPPLLSCDRVEADLLWQWSFLGVSAFSAAYTCSHSPPKQMHVLTSHQIQGFPTPGGGGHTAFVQSGR